MYQDMIIVLRKLGQIAILLFPIAFLFNCGEGCSKEIIDSSIPTVDEIADNLKIINEHGNRGNYFIYFLNNEYLVQAAANKGDYFVRCEASHNLITNNLSNDQKSKLEKLGWISPDAGELNYWIMGSISTDEELIKLSELITETIKVVYKSSSVDSLVVHIGK